MRYSKNGVVLGFKVGHPNYVFEEGRRKQSDAMKRAWAEGRIQPYFSPEARKKMGDAMRGKRHSKEAREKISAAVRERVRKGTHNLLYLTDEQRRLIAQNRRKPRISAELRASRRARFSGPSNPQWKGGVTPLSVEIRNCDRMKLWRCTVFKRDHYRCKACGERRNLEAHHLVPFSQLVKKLFAVYKGKPTLQDALNFPLLWSVTNGETLCKNCHSQTFICFGNQFGKVEEAL